LTTRSMANHAAPWGTWALASIVGLPALWALWGALAALGEPTNWAYLSWRTALHSAGLSLAVAACSTAVSVVLANGLLRWAVGRPSSVGWLAPMLATPHLAFALAFGLLIAPTGWLSRAVSPGLSGWLTPPDWATTHDPWGLAMVAVLICKEVPFLLWVGWSEWQRPDQALRWQQLWSTAQTLGQDPATAWRGAVAPLLWQRMRWPVVAVWAYGLAVVDVGLAIGPTNPPTLAVQAWLWLLDPEPQVQSLGTWASWALAAVTAMGAAWVAWAFRATRHVHTQGPGEAWLASSRWALWGLVARSGLAIYAALLALTLVSSFSQLWPFPALWPQSWSTRAWQQVSQTTEVWHHTITLALASTVLVLVWTVAWLELADARWQRRVGALAMGLLLCPPLLWLLGLHPAMIALDLDNTVWGVLIGHCLAVLPYLLLTLAPAYLGFEDRYTQVAATLGHGWWSQRWRVKWPSLRAALWRSAAVGFAVSVAQYLPTQWLGGGRVITVTTEALAQSSGGQRALTSAWSLAQWLLPLLGFALAAWAARARHGPMTSARSTTPTPATRTPP
jgi:putative thiamine transport system permease protein